MTVTVLTLAIRYNRRLMHRDAAGMPTEAAIVIRIAKRDPLSGSSAIWEKDEQISHHTGALLITSSAQTTELTKVLRHASADHII